MILVMYSNFVPSPEHLERLARESAGMTVHAVHSEEDASRLAPGAQLILGHRYLRQMWRRRCAGLPGESLAPPA